MKDIRNLIILALAMLLICDLVFRKTEKVEQVVDQHMDEVARLTLDVINLKGMAATEKKKRADDSLKDIARDMAYKKQITGLQKKLAAVPTLARATAPELDSIGAVILPVPNTDTLYAMPIMRAREAFAEVMRSRAKDEIIVAQAARIDTLKKEKEMMREDFGAQIATGNEVLKKTEEINQHLDAVVDEVQGANKKLSRTNKILRALIPIGFGGGAALGVWLSK